MAERHAKYIIFVSGLVLVFPVDDSHANQAMIIPEPDKPVSAGFIEWDDGYPFAHGYSYTLGRLHSRPEDSEIIAKHLGMRKDRVKEIEINELLREIENDQTGC